MLKVGSESTSQHNRSLGGVPFVLWPDRRMFCVTLGCGCLDRPGTRRSKFLNAANSDGSFEKRSPPFLGACSCKSKEIDPPLNFPRNIIAATDLPWDHSSACLSIR